MEEQKNLQENGEWEVQVGGDFWKPQEPGQPKELTGVVDEIENAGKFGAQYWIKDSTGKRWKTPAHKVLQSRMMKAKDGMTVKIVYKGRELPTVKGNNPTEMYEVYFRKPTGSPSKSEEVGAFAN